MTAELTDEDRGKALVSRNKRLGVVTDVGGDTVYLDVDFDNVPEELREELDWEPGADTNTLEQSAVEAARNDQVVVRDDIWPR